MGQESLELVLPGLTVIAGDGLENSSFRSPGNIHRHPFWEVHFIRAGRSELVAEGERRVLESGELLVIPPETPHALLPLEKGARRSAFLAAPRAGAALFGELFAVETVRILKDDFGGGVRAEELRRELVSGKPYGKLRARALCELLVIDLCRTLGGTRREPGAERSERGMIEDYIHGEHACREGIGGLARRLGMSERNTSRRVRMIYGRNFRELLLEQRMSMARLYLEQGLSVAQTAERLGYAEKSAFCHAFRRFFGETPGKVARSGQKE